LPVLEALFGADCRLEQFVGEAYAAES
jgi:hypothetical protein